MISGTHTPSAPRQNIYTRQQPLVVKLLDSARRFKVDDESMQWAAFALERAERALAKDPKSVYGLKQRALARLFIAIRTGFIHLYSGVLSDYEEILRQNPKDAISHINNARALVSLGRVDDAVRSYKRALDLSPSAQLYGEYGNYLHDLGRHAEAILPLDQAIRLDPSSSGAYMLKGEALLKAKRPDEAAECFRRLTERFPKSAPAHNRLAAALFEAKKYDEAKGSLTRAVSIDPGDPSFRPVQTDLTRWIGSAARPGAHYAADGSISLDDFSPAFRARRLLNAGRHFSAIDEFQEALEHSPDDVSSLLGLGLALLAARRFVDALGAFDRAASINKSSLAAHSNRGRTLAILGRHEEALRAFETATGINPNDADMHLRGGNSLYRLGRSQDAARACQRAVDLEPASPEAHKLMATILGSLGRHLEALDSIDRALQMVPNDAISHVHRGYILESLGRVSDSRGAFNRAIKINPDMWSLVPQP